ncbi:MAG: GTP cyclohydrolase II [Spirochaetaceae bacterium]|nr:GTP cyclohydrolase II [Spirochaetaceae bacterium]
MIIPTVEEIIRQDVDFLRHCPGELDCAACQEKLCVMVASVADFPTQYGQFSIVGFVNNKDGKDHIMVVKGDIGDGENFFLRIHSACLTGDALGSLRCDCGPQLHHALERIEAEGRGAVLYHQAEGRGIGLVNKLRAYALQDSGYDTYDANVALGFRADERDYAIPAAMLKKLGIRSVRLMTNNPDKVAALQQEGVVVKERIQHELPAQEHDRAYLETKKERFGHFLELDHTEYE